MLIVKQDLINHTTQPVLFIDEGTPDKERITLSGGMASIEILTGAYEGLQITDSNKVVKRVKTSEITSTQILPAAAIPFAGTTQDLKDLLVADFFFDVVSSDGGIGVFFHFGTSGEYTQTQTLLVQLQNSAAILPGFNFAIPVILDGSYNEFALLKLGSAFTGNFNFAIYEEDKTPGAPSLPKTRVWQSVEKNLSTPKQLVQYPLAPAVNFAPGKYFFAYQADVAFTFTGNASTLGMLGIDVSGVPSLANISRLFSAVPYASTMPTTWTAPILKSLAGTPPLLLQKKVL